MAPSSLRIPPQSLDSEKALLGSLMLRPEGLHEIIDTVSADSFYAERHRTIFKAMLDLFGKSDPIDLISLSNRLKEKESLELIGGSSYLTELVNLVPSAANLKHYAEVVQKKYMMRGLIGASEYIAELGYDESQDLEETLDRAEKKIYEVTASPTLHKFVAMRETLGEAWERLERLHHSKNELRGIPTGFRELDNMLAGFQQSDLVILAARPSMGKTALALDIARQTAVKHGTVVGIFSLEMSAQQLVDRMLAAESRVNAWKLRTGQLSTDEEFDKIRDSLDQLSRAPIYIDDQPGNNILKMRSVARRLKRENGLGLIIVDYLQLMAPTQSRSSDSLVQQVTEISRSLKNLARELEVPVLALSQLSRAVEQRRGKPRLSDLRDSGCLSGDTVVINAKTGARHTMRELAASGDSMPVFALDKHFHLREATATRFFSSGVKRLYTLKTRSGRTIRASANHPFRTIEGWKHLDELTLGVPIAVPRGLRPNKIASSLSRDELIFIAHLLGDGCVLPKQPYHYTTASLKNRATVEHASARLFAITPRIVRQKNWWHVYFTSPYRLTHGRRHPITLWFEKLGIERVRSYKKKIPEEIFQCSEADIALFLKHLWSTDGNVSATRNVGGSSGAAIYYASSSAALALQVSHLLLRLSIRATVRTIKSGTYRPMHHVSIEGAPEQIRFLETIGIADEREETVPSLLKVLRSVKPNTNVDVTPKEAWRLVIAPALKDAEMSWRDFSARLGVAYNGTAIQKSGIGRDRLAAIAAIVKSPLCLELATAHVLWDPIISIEKGEEEEVFDATVSGLHNFVADDVIVHNSIEQDADVVMFIHREDKMNETSSRPNIAEILIEKHRNGPVGKIELFFDEKKTTFLSVDKSDFGEFASTHPGAAESF